MGMCLRVQHPLLSPLHHTWRPRVPVAPTTRMAFLGTGVPPLALAASAAAAWQRGATACLLPAGHRAETSCSWLSCTDQVDVRCSRLWPARRPAVGVAAAGAATALPTTQAGGAAF